MMAVVRVRRSTLRSARPAARASGIGLVVQQDQHAVGVGEVALVLLDARARQRSAQFGRQRTREQLGQVEVGDFRKDGAQFLELRALGRAAHVQDVEQAAAGIADRADDLLQAAPAVVLDDDAGARGEIGAKVGIDALRVSHRRSHPVVDETSSQRATLDEKLDLEDARKNPMEGSNDQLVLTDGQRSHNSHYTGVRAAPWSLHVRYPAAARRG